MEKRELTCIGCPMGCQITVTLDGGEVKNVEGNTCRKGDQYARAEVTHPVRVVTSSVPAEGGEIACECSEKHLHIILTKFNLESLFQVVYCFVERL